MDDNSSIDTNKKKKIIVTEKDNAKIKYKSTILLYLYLHLISVEQPLLDEILKMHG
jgi:hypothetical protein